MKELGEYLKNTREVNGVGIEEASSDIEIPEYELESIEIGNIKAFKDTLALKEKIRKYAKYLGLDPQQVIDDFNDFMFEHTSKISLEDIREAEQKYKKENDKKVTSPYTKVYPPKKNLKPLIMTAIVFLGVIVICLLFLLIFKPKKPIQDYELSGILERGVINEFTK